MSVLYFKTLPGNKRQIIIPSKSGTDDQTFIVDYEKAELIVEVLSHYLKFRTDGIGGSTFAQDEGKTKFKSEVLARLRNIEEQLKPKIEITQTIETDPRDLPSLPNAPKHYEGHVTLAEMIQGHICHWRNAIEQFAQPGLREHELSALRDIEAAVKIDVELFQ